MNLYAAALLAVIFSAEPSLAVNNETTGASADSVVIVSDTAAEIEDGGPGEKTGQKEVETEYDIDSLENYDDSVKAGISLMEKGYYFQARKVYHKALGFQPENAEIYNLLGRAYYHTSENEKAKMFLKTAIAIKQDYAEAHYNLGDVYFREGKLNDAMNSFKTAIKINSAYRKKTRKFFGEMFAPLE